MSFVWSTRRFFTATAIGLVAAVASASSPTQTLRRVPPDGAQAPAADAVTDTVAAGPRPTTADDLVARIEAAWTARDTAAYLSLWDFESDDARHTERDSAVEHLSSEQTDLRVQRGSAIKDASETAVAHAQVFTVNEPRSRVEQWRLRLERRPDGWVLANREITSQIDGLIHLSLDPNGYRADGLVLRLEDFELRMAEGTLFLSPGSLGPTLLVFVGTATVKVSPRPPTEREQLKKFCGKPEMVERVRAAFARIHPADLHRVLIPADLQRDPDAPRRLEAAQRFYREQSGRSFVLDTALPRSPWWLFPSVGDALVALDTRRGTLTFTVSHSEPEAISLFDRVRRKQICLYPAAGGSLRYREDEGRTVDVLHHDLRVRFDPGRSALAGEDTLRIRLLAPAATIRLKLSDDLRVESVTSMEGSHLFFRVRNQDSVMISLGPLAGTVGEVSLTVRFSGIHFPGTIEREVLPQVFAPPEDDQPDIQLENVLVYTNRAAWYPQTPGEDHARATLRFDVPAGYDVVAGGERSAARTEGGRTVVEYRQEQPGRYVSVGVGRFLEAGEATVDGVALRAFGTGRTRSEAAAILSRAGDILRFYAGEFGPFPFPSLNLAVVEGYTPGGHSPPGMVLLQRRPPMLRGGLMDDPTNFSDVPDFFFAHELAHQWWGHGVAGQNYRERWLSEGAAHYAAALWVRRSQGEATFRDVLRRMARWAFRHGDEGPLILGYRLGHLKGNPQVFRAVAYDKGAYVLHMLRGIVGEEAFRRALVQFQAEHRFSKAGSDDLREALQAASGKELEAYFHDWVYGTRLPSLHVSSRSAKAPSGFETVVDVRAQHLPGPVPVEVSVDYPGGRAARKVLLAPEGGRFTIETPGMPGKVEVNSDRGLLATIEKG